MRLLKLFTICTLFLMGLLGFCNAEQALSDPLTIFVMEGAGRRIVFNGRTHQSFTGFLLHLRDYYEQHDVPIFDVSIWDDAMTASELHLLIESLRDICPNGIEIYIDLVRTAKSVGEIPRSQKLTVVCEDHENLVSTGQYSRSIERDACFKTNCHCRGAVSGANVLVDIAE